MDFSLTQTHGPASTPPGRQTSPTACTPADSPTIKRSVSAERELPGSRQPARPSIRQRHGLPRAARRTQRSQPPDRRNGCRVRRVRQHCLRSRLRCHPRLHRPQRRTPLGDRQRDQSFRRATLVSKRRRNGRPAWPSSATSTHRAPNAILTYADRPTISTEEITTRLDDLGCDIAVGYTQRQHDWEQTQIDVWRVENSDTIQRGIDQKQPVDPVRDPGVAAFPHDLVVGIHAFDVNRRPSPMVPSAIRMRAT